MTLAGPSHLLAAYQVASSPLESQRSETWRTLAKVSKHLFQIEKIMLTYVPFSDDSDISVALLKRQ